MWKFYIDVKGCHRDISTKDSWAAWDELLAKIGEAGDALWTRDIGEILNHLWVETDFWTLRYIIYIICTETYKGNIVV